MSIQSEDELKKLRNIGRIVRAALDAMAAAVQPGVTTAELNRIGAAVLAQEQAQSAPPKVYGFPGEVCISVNDEAVHGIPGNRTLMAGDLVKLDLVAEKDGLFADAAVTARVGEVSPAADALVRCAQTSFAMGLRAARVGNRVYEIGRAVDGEVRSCGFRVIKELCGHGVGRTIHEPPSVPNYRDPKSRTPLTDGLVITIEPIIASGSGEARLDANGWTVRTADHSLAAHYEHTVVVTRRKPILITA